MLIYKLPKIETKKSDYRRKRTFTKDNMMVFTSSCAISIICQYIKYKRYTMIPLDKIEKSVGILNSTFTHGGIYLRSCS